MPNPDKLTQREKKLLIWALEKANGFTVMTGKEREEIARLVIKIQGRIEYCSILVSPAL